MPENEYSYGHVNERVAGVSATLDLSGEIISLEYNMSDHSGYHAVNDPHPAGIEIIAELNSMAAVAILDAQVKHAYRMERRRETDFSQFRYAFLATWGRGGSTVYHDEQPDCSSELQGYGFTDVELDEINRLSIPFVDTRTMPFKSACATMRLPMWPSKLHKADSAPWSSLSYAPVPKLAYLYKALGATVRNLEVQVVLPEELRGMQDWEAKALAGYTTGNSTLLMEAMMEARHAVA
jgi:hypothetical protein